MIIGDYFSNVSEKPVQGYNNIMVIFIEYSMSLRNVFDQKHNLT